MRAIRNKNTKPELKLRAILEAADIDFELHVRALPGTPDIVLQNHRVAIFANGCFWHGHDCYLFKLPENRREFWANKIEQTRERDKKKWQALHSEDWRVLVVWECALKGRLRHDDESLSQYFFDWLSLEKNSPHYHFCSIRCRDESDTE